MSELAKHRKGELVEIKDADSFFKEISENIEALETINDNHPLTADIAVARLKKYLIKEENRIFLHDLLFSEQEKAIKQTNLIDDFTLYPDNKNLAPQLIRYRSSMEVLIPLIINGVYWSGSQSYDIFVHILLRFSDPPKYPNSRFYDDSKYLHYFPSLLVLYSLGVACVISQKYDLLNKCFHLKIAQSEHDPSEFNLIEIIHPQLIEIKRMNEILATNNGTPLSLYLKQIIRPYFKELIPRDLEFDDMFDVFEYLLALNYIELRDENVDMDWAPYGLFKFNSYSGYRRASFLKDDFLKDADTKESKWPPILMGMFNGDYEKFNKVKLRLDEFLKRIY